MWCKIVHELGLERTLRRASRNHLVAWQATVCVALVLLAGLVVYQVTAQVARAPVPFCVAVLVNEQKRPMIIALRYGISNA